MLQLRPRGTDAIPYAPARDIVYIMPDIARVAADRLEDRRFEAMHSWLDAEDITLDDLGEACGAFCRFMTTAHENPDESMDDVLKRAGWYDVKPPARVAWTFYTGAQLTGMFFNGVRNALLEGEETLLDVRRLSHVPVHVHRTFLMSRKRYFWYRIWHSIKRWVPFRFRRHLFARRR